MSRLIIFFWIIFSTNIPHLISKEINPPLIYLATYPRSGNHWTRYLVEEASQIVTFSVYPDTDHISMGPWDSFYKPNGYFDNCRLPETNENVLIKTHYPCAEAYSSDLKPAIHTIRIIRHPIDSIYSFHFLGQETTYGTRIPLENLKYYINLWRTFQEYWDNQDNITNIYYEDMLDDPHLYLSTIMDIIGYNVDENDLLRAIEKFPPVGHVLKHLSFYENEDLLLIQSELSDLLEKHGYTIPFD